MCNIIGLLFLDYSMIHIIKISISRIYFVRVETDAVAKYHCWLYYFDYVRQKIIINEHENENENDDEQKQ